LGILRSSPWLGWPLLIVCVAGGHGPWALSDPFLVRDLSPG
jgi:hypothetical protein